MPIFVRVAFMLEHDLTEKDIGKLYVDANGNILKIDDVRLGAIVTASSSDHGLVISSSYKANGEHSSGNPKLRLTAQYYPLSPDHQWNLILKKVDNIEKMIRHIYYRTNHGEITNELEPKDPLR